MFLLASSLSHSSIPLILKTRFVWKNCAPALTFFCSRNAWNFGFDANGEAAAPRKNLGGILISRPSRYFPSSRKRRKIQSIWIASRSLISIVSRGEEESLALSPVTHRILRTPRAEAPITSLCRFERERLRAAICITGSAPLSNATWLHADEVIRGVAEALSVKL